ncbi:MAG: MoaD/ThiS family protein [Euryarchaeota archaeon]|nr:MoaD/ThiS family protein [Euryarchaeota archaeon]
MQRLVSPSVTSLSELLTPHQQSLLAQGMAHVFINGERVEDLEGTRVEPGSHVLFLPRIAGG